MGLKGHPPDPDLLAGLQFGHDWRLRRLGHRPLQPLIGGHPRTDVYPPDWYRRQQTGQISHMVRILMGNKHGIQALYSVITEYRQNVKGDSGRIVPLLPSRPGKSHPPAGINQYPRPIAPALSLLHI